MAHPPNKAAVFAIIAVVACCATIFVLDLGEPEDSINLEVDLNAAPNANNKDKCREIQAVLSTLHGRFWKEAKHQLKLKYGQGMSSTIRKTFTEKMDSITARLAKAGCGTNESEECVKLHQAQSGVVQAVKDQVNVLLKDNKEFVKSFEHLEGTTQDLQQHLTLMRCGSALAQPASEVDTTTREIPRPKRKNVAEMASELRLQRLKDQLTVHANKVAEEQEKAAQEKRRIRDSVKEEKGVLAQHQKAISEHLRRAAEIKKKIDTVKWAQNQRDALLHGSEIPPPPAADYGGADAQDMPPSKLMLDETIGSMFDENFHQGDHTHSETLLQISAKPAKEATKGKGSLAQFKLAIHTPIKPNNLQKERKKVMKKLSQDHPESKTALATAQAVEEVNIMVRSAAKTAAEAAAQRALQQGLSAKETKVYVKQAAALAAKAAVKQAHAKFDENVNEPTPTMLAKSRLRVTAQELLGKAAQKKKQKLQWQKEDQATTKSAMVGVAHSKEMKQVLQAALATKQGGKNMKMTAKKMRAAEVQAVAAEAFAWKNEVGTADTHDKVLEEIHEYQKAHGGMSLPTAAQKWEEGEVLKMKKRFARHFLKALKTNPTSKDGKLQALHEVDRQRINAEKMVLKNAELRAFVSKRNAEKSEKSNMRLKAAAERYQLAATTSVDSKVKHVQQQEDSIQKQALAKVLAKDAAETLKAKTEANAAKSDAKQAEAEKKEALGALTVARKKLHDLSKAAAAGTAMLGVKLKHELKAQQEQVADKIRAVKAATTKEVTLRTKKEQKKQYHQRLKQAKEEFQKNADQSSHRVEGHAAAVVKAAEQAAVAAKTMAQKESQVAERAQGRSKEIADEAEARADATKAAAAAQMARFSKQKAAALKHFSDFSLSLKELETEKSAKAERKILEKQHEADVATQEAAKVARFAEEQMTEADMQASQASMSKVAAAGATLQNAIDSVSTVDVRARGQASITAEKQALMEKAKAKKLKKTRAIKQAKEKAEKADLAVKEHATKAVENAKEKVLKKVARERKQKSDAISKEGYDKGFQRAQTIINQKAKEQARVLNQQLATVKARALERQAKRLMKQSDSAVLSPVQQQAKKLVGQAVSDVKANEQVSTAVSSAQGKLKRFIGSSHHTAAAQISRTPAAPSHLKKVLDDAVHSAKNAAASHDLVAKATMDAIKELAAHPGN